MRSPENTSKMYLAHIAEDGREQTVQAHLSGTAQLASRFAQAFDAAPYGRLAGMAHDIGKYSPGFQRRLHGGPKVDHSTAGALECAAIGEELVGMCVAGHHSGLPDFGNAATDGEGDVTFVSRVKKMLPQRLSAYPGWDGVLPQTPPTPSFPNGFARSLWTRMLFSSLVDADYLDTESFMYGQTVDRGTYASLSALRERLHAYVTRWSNPTTELNAIRNQILRDCIQAGRSSPGLFSLTVPTGGGKTIASLAFALEHAVHTGKDRVIYVIPYTSIIEQNAAVFRSILGEENVIEHHAEANLSDEDDGQSRQAYAVENWDAPVIVTTAVQFFDSLFSNRSSKCRKLHNIANSVVIFDEAQMLPTGHLLPCTAVIGTLCAQFRVSAVLCTATQPMLSDLLSRFAADFPVREICRDTAAVFRALRRVEYASLGMIEPQALAEKVSRHRQTLCIVNTRKAAKDLYDRLDPDGSFHLSTLMYPKHRQAVLSQIRMRLADRQPCRVISTSLIEAGVDVDFPCVFRELNGLDSVVQAAGRCNREGKRAAKDSVVTTFSMPGTLPPLMRVNIGAAKEALFGNADPGDPQTMDRYFRSYRALMGSGIDKTDAVKHLSEGKAGCALPFKTVAEEFHMIDSTTRTVYIPCTESEPCIEAIRSGTADRHTYRRAGQYSIQLYDAHYQALLSAGDIEEIAPGCAYLVNMALYHMNTGLSLQADAGKALFV